jgi:hypothetical protein
VSTKEERLLAGRAIFAKVIGDEVKKDITNTRGLLEPGIAPDEGVAAELPDGTRIGTVKKSKPAKTACVTDYEVLLAWVKQHRPEELVQSVNPAFVDALKDTARKYGQAVLTDGTVVPGIELVDGTSSYLPQVDKSMVPMIQQVFAQFLADGPRALPNGNGAV